jgi:GNAT superfamily N-acetyltransferase
MSLALTLSRMPRIATLAERPDLIGHLPFGEGWPEIIFHDAVAKQYMPRVDELFQHLNVVVLDDEDRVIAGGWGVPIVWDGDVGHLPAGWDGALEQSILDHDAGRLPEALCTMAAEVVAGHRGQGLGGIVLSTLKDKAWEHGLSYMIAPARPTLKARYPLTPIEQYAQWVRADGTPFDPWLRTHTRVGAHILGVTKRSMLIEGTVEEWEEWANMAFPESGRYVVPDALDLVSIDREGNRGLYAEPAVWMRHS